MHLPRITSLLFAVAGAMLVPSPLQEGSLLGPPQALEPRQSNGTCEATLEEMFGQVQQLAAYANQVATVAGQMVGQHQGGQPSSTPSPPPPPSSQQSSPPSSAATTTTAAAAPTTSASNSTGGPAGTATAGAPYAQHTGDGSTAQKWPDLTGWYPSVEAMWNANAEIMRGSCGNLSPAAANNSDAELAALRGAVASAAGEARMDARFVLAIVLQESGGCTRVHTTVSPDGSVRNPGLMQSHDGNGTCNANGTAVQPCPDAQIVQMVRDGVLGTAAGDGLVQGFAKGGGAGAGAQAYYRAARMYNSGAVDAKDLGDGMGATACYCSDVANRLSGWNEGVSKCTLK